MKIADKIRDKVSELNVKERAGLYCFLIVLTVVLTILSHIVLPGKVVFSMWCGATASAMIFYLYNRILLRLQAKEQEKCRTRIRDGNCPKRCP